MSLHQGHAAFGLVLPCNSLLLGISGEPNADGQFAERRDRVGGGLRDEENGTVTPLTHERVDQQL